MNAEVQWLKNAIFLKHSICKLWFALPLCVVPCFFFPLFSWTMKYPPAISSNDRQTVLTDAIDWALAHGLVVRPTVDKQHHFKNQSAVTHAPFALYPTPFPRAEFEKAKGLQQPWNTLIHQLSLDDALIKKAMSSYVCIDKCCDRHKHVLIHLHV